MSAESILNFFVSDIITAVLISSVFLFISNKHQDRADKEQQKQLDELAQIIELRLEQQTLQLEKYFNEKK